MKALFMCPTLDVGGAERQWVALLPGLRDFGIRVSAVTLRGAGLLAAELRDADVPVASVSMRNRWDWRALRSVPALVPDDVDLIVTRSVNALSVGAYIASRHACVHVSTEHTQYDLLPLRIHQRMITRALAPHVDAVTCVTSTQIEPLISLGYSPARISVIPNGVEIDRLRPIRSRGAMREELNIAPDAFLVVQLAALRPEKRPLDFIDAMVQARRRNTRLVGVLVGDGVERPLVDEACAQSGGAARSIGARTDIADILNAADAVCLTSSHEALPIALLEARVAGKPIVATDVGGVRNVVRPGYDGELVHVGHISAFADAVVRLAADPERAAKMGEAGRERLAPSFDHRRMVDSYAQLFEAVVRSRGSARGRSR